MTIVHTKKMFQKYKTFMNIVVYISLLFSLFYPRAFAAHLVLPQTENLFFRTNISPMMTETPSSPTISKDLVLPNDHMDPKTAHDIKNPISNATSQSTPITIDLKTITTVPLTKNQETWFMKEFTRSFLAVYQNKTFVINKDGKPTIVGPNHLSTKTSWLDDTAKEEFQDYVLKPKEGYKAILIQYKKLPIGALLYRELKDEKTIYLAQYFILPEFQQKGIGVHVLKLIPKLYPDYKRIEILARHQNDAAFLLYNKAGFSIGDTALVKKYDYDPLHYMGFFKVLP